MDWAPQTPPTADDTIADLVAQAKAATVKPDPAIGVLSTSKTLTGGRQALTPGADVGTTSRRPGPAEPAPATLLDLTPQERNELVRLATAQGRIGDENGTARAAHEQAAMIQALAKRGDFTTSEDSTPGRSVNPQGVAGFTRGHGRVRGGVALMPVNLPKPSQRQDDGPLCTSPCIQRSIIVG